MSVETVATQLAVIERRISGVKQAFDLSELPDAMHDSYLPAFVNVPTTAEYSWPASLYAEEVRTWRLLLYVCPVERPVDVAKRMVLLAPWFRRVVLEFAKSLFLDDLSGISLSLVQADDGVDTLDYAGALFAGIEFRLSVRDTFTVESAT